MALGTLTREILIELQGVLGAIDSTRNRLKGVGAGLYMMTQRQGIGIRKTTTATKGGSAARHARSTAYCDCDCEYKTLGSYRRGKIMPWYLIIFGTPEKALTGYMEWMKLCLRKMPIRVLFATHVWYGRWLIDNDTDVDLVMGIFILEFSKIQFTDSRDLVIALVDANGNLVEELDTAVISGNAITVTIPLLGPHTHVYADAYVTTNIPSSWVAP